MFEDDQIPPTVVFVNTIFVVVHILLLAPEIGVTTGCGFTVIEVLLVPEAVGLVTTIVPVVLVPATIAVICELLLTTKD